MEESISLEETNKIRISLGLKPLTEDKAPADADNKEQQAERNYANHREAEAKERETKYESTSLHFVATNIFYFSLGVLLTALQSEYLSSLQITVTSIFAYGRLRPTCR